MRIPDFLNWRFELDIAGKPTIYHLAVGVKYRVSALLAPKARMRLINEEGYVMGAYRATSSVDWPMYDTFTCDPDWGSYCMVQHIGKVENVFFEMIGLDFEHFK